MSGASSGGAPPRGGPRRLGVAGGTFDPIHLGHVAMADAARECARLDLVVLMPAGDPPHRGAPTAPAAARLQMCRLAVAGLPGFEVSELEVRRPGPSYTVDTLRELHRLRPEAELFLILGWDAAREMGSWHRPDEVQDLARPVIVDRPGLGSVDAARLREAGIDPERALVCHRATPDIEATEVRRRLERGESLEGLLAPAVVRYIREGGLYRADNSAR